MKICILAVCHNSYIESLKFLKSILISINKTSIELDIFFIDNSSLADDAKIELIKNFDKRINIKYFRSKNLGYFPSISHMLLDQSINLSSYDYSIISNVDLLMSDSFFENIAGNTLTTFDTSTGRNRVNYNLALGSYTVY